MTATFTILGVKYRFYKTHPNRWSDGKVHLQLWRKEIKEWVMLCRANDATGFGSYNGTTLDAPAKLTCKSCIRHDPRP